MNQYLRYNEPCPIHAGSKHCSCHRTPRNPKRRIRLMSGPVTRVPDEHATSGYREICTKAEMRRRKNILIRNQQGKCWFCHEAFTTILEVETHHIRAKGMGAARQDDRLENLAAVHSRLSEKACHGKIHDGRAA